MPHLRKRYLDSPFKELMGFSPLIGILGHRQVGKTTFLENHCDPYLTFDDFDTRNEATIHPKRFIESLKKKNTAIDESQLAEGIFPALKERVRTNKQPGQFVLSGSVRFTSKKSIQESLTGRIQYLELLPMTMRELENESLSNFLDSIFKSTRMESLAETLEAPSSLLSSKKNRIQDYLFKGGLPGVCFIRKESLRHAKILDQLRTILDRDLRQIHASKLTFDQLLLFLSTLAKNEGKPHHYQSVRRATGLTPITQQRLLYAFESIFLIRRIPIVGLPNAFTVMLEDQAESHYLTEGALSIDQQMISMLSRNLRSEFFYRVGYDVKTFQFRVRSKSGVPLVFQSQSRSAGFLFSHQDSVDRKTKGAAGTFLKAHENSKVIIVHLENKFEIIDSRTLLCPIAALL